MKYYYYVIQGEKVIYVYSKVETRTYSFFYCTNEAFDISNLCETAKKEHGLDSVIMIFFTEITKKMYELNKRV